MGSDVKIARALISVTDKTGVVDFARTLVDDFGVEIISTGGTARAIEDAGKYLPDRKMVWAGSKSVCINWK